MILIYSRQTGRILRYVNAPVEELTFQTQDGEAAMISDSAASGETNYIENGELVPFPAKPSPHHEWDWTTKSWLPNLDAAREAKVQQVAVELNKRLYLPCNGFDADNVSRNRISGTIARLQRGDGLPVGWIGWRDAANEMHWATDDAATVLANLTTLSRAIEDREQALLATSWQHKASIASLTSIEDILNYNVEGGWDG